jgi:hypothetical protein
MQRRLHPAPTLLLALAVGACEQGRSTSPDALGPISTILASQTAVEECTVVTFDGFSHGDAVTAINVLGVPLTLSALRYDNLVAVDPTAYDVELTGADLAALDATHDDTQAERDCAQCLGHGRTLVVPDENFAVGGDNTEGGEITISGFAADPDPTAVWSISAFDVVDADVGQGFTTLFVDNVQTAQNTLTGNATVETVAVPANTITTDIRFTIGSVAIDASSGIDNLNVCRTTTEEEDGEGCTPGYWKQEQHFDSWVTYAPGDFYDEVFGVGPHITLLAALESEGGGELALLRHSVGALLNAAGDVDYGMTEAEVIAAVQAAYAIGTKDAFEAAKDDFEALNERFCPLD